MVALGEIHARQAVEAGGDAWMLGPKRPFRNGKGPLDKESPLRRSGSVAHYSLARMTSVCPVPGWRAPNSLSESATAFSAIRTASSKRPS